MMKRALLLFAATLSIAALVACSPDTESTQEQAACTDAAMQPWPPDLATPQTVDDSLAALDAWLTQPQKQYFRCENREHLLVDVHFGLALQLRNHWNLGPAGPLGAELAALGLQHVDDMSNFIALKYIHSLRDEPFDEELFLQNAREHWRRFESAIRDRG